MPSRLLLATLTVLAHIPFLGAAEPASTFQARDTLSVGEETSADAQACLDGLCWTPTTFDVTLEPPRDHGGMEAYVRFPSPRPSGNAINDLVSMEWYPALDENRQRMRAPAVVVVHESGSQMEVGRLFAKALAARKVHAFLIQLPYYGPRKPEGFSRDADNVLPALRQAVADVRRARDAVAVLPDVDGAHVSLQGTSLGGFVTASVAGLDAGYQRVFIMLAGGDLYGVITNGTREAAQLRELLEKKGYTGERLREIILPIEPLRLAHRIRPDATWIYSADKDQVVPLQNVQRLADAAKLPADHHVTLWGDHYKVIVYFPVIIEHIDQRLSRPE